MPALRFKTCRLLSGNVRNKELTIVQRRILRKLRMKKRSIKKKIYPRKNRNSYIQLQTTRKLSLFYGNLPITKMHRRTKRTSYIPFLLNPETRLDVILVRWLFSTNHKDIGTLYFIFGAILLNCLIICGFTGGVTISECAGPDPTPGMGEAGDGGNPKMRWINQPRSWGRKPLIRYG